MVEPLWTPSHHHLHDSALARFQRHVARRHTVPAEGFDGLWRWSTSELESFWGEVWDWFDLPARPEGASVLEGEDMPGGYHWFPGVTLNYAGFVLAQGDPDDEAVIGTTEAGHRRALSRHELREQVLGFAATLRRLGVEEGDRVVGYLPNIPEAVVAFLGTAAIGATWSAVGQDYAPDAVVHRFAQLEPRVLVAADGYHWAGRRVDRLPGVAELAHGLPTLEHTIVVSHLGADAPTGAIAWADAVAVRDEQAPLEPMPVPFEHPLWVLYSSGTTGLPKGMVHGHGGILLEMLKLLSLHIDIGAGDRFFWYTSPSWVMWNIQASALAVGASIVCHDGSPVHPSPARLWEVVADERVTFLGISPGYLQACQNAAVRPREQCDLSHLRGMGSTGSPLAPHLHHWALDAVGPVPLWSVSGGTDVGSGFALGAPTVPIWPGEISVPALGVALDAWDDDGRPVRGIVGEMVITAPMPSMPLHFWNDPGLGRYRDAYFTVYPGVWRHGDWITITERGSVVIHGRSDSTLNRHGVRMGSADIYSAVETIPEVTEALVIGAEQQDASYWMPLFVVLQDGRVLDEDLVARIKSAIREKASPRHVPDEVRQIRAVPHTRTGKKLEVPVKRILQGLPIGKAANPDTIDDPSLLDDFAAIRRERYPT
ncbi:MAG: acetoacetate--CoA ligase [Intrasporangium sp.]|uniref:acetoacetate--CoA ligase n=1 Tax=Intrasporangium sp. TaxID=1925024 RepID=UPI00264A4E4F|nr:acetoacetate--CoA ligase [Intrasporangium sp.]MDN5795513.1 acetoacetate--CoA ligase [Intrasporangium sp.]